MPAVPRLRPEEQRVLGCLLEKRLATPDQYPLSRNALVAACNQSTNREPVVDYDEAVVRGALDRLGDRRLTRAASGPGSRAPKHRHLVRETLELDEAGQALLALLLLRGPQTAAELRQRSGRLHAFADGGAAQAALDALADRGLAADVGRRPGERGTRWAHQLREDAPTSGPADDDASAAAPPAGDAGSSPTARPERAPRVDAGPGGAVPPREPGPMSARAPDLAAAGTGSTADAEDERTTDLEADVAALREEVAELRRGLDELRGELGA